ncbi:hypothetical protein K438DRAFT_1763310 [Mycena galopus ATCC 62051]|nr:hypothetical protein K438DRAFT_1763310 [Mycena galopus ATCC 62051]
MSDVEDENAVETGLSNALNQLKAHGISKEKVQEDATDEEIHELVQKMCADCENQEINGGDDGLNDPAPAPKPTQKEALQVVSTLRKYLADVDGTFARKLEVGLATFGSFPETHTL